MKKEVKDTIIVDLGEEAEEYPHFYLVDVTGYECRGIHRFRRKCFKKEIKMVVVKNKLLHKAFEAADIDYL
jgi:large subunit ribosomal protein L10